MNNVNNTPVKTSIFYINDYHGKSINMERTANAAKFFDCKYKNTPNTDVLKLSSGDIMIGEDIQTNLIAIWFQNMIGINASTLGNHEFDMQDNLKHVLPEAKYNVVSSNITINPQNPIANKIKTSVIEEVNGHKYGIIGASPIDLFKRTKKGKIQQDIKLSGLYRTIEDVQREVDKLQAQGINKIIFLSHLGYQFDKIIAAQTTGIDVILGGHSHDLVRGITEGENLFYNKYGEPIVITQAGRNGNNFGILNLEFSNNGVITKIQNNVGDTQNFSRNLAFKYVFDKMFGCQETYGTINSAPEGLKNALLDINPHAYYITDCIKKDLNPDIVLYPSANIRGHFDKGAVNARTLANILPFKNKLYMINYSEKDIIDAIKEGGKSFNNIANKPGIFYCAGINYTMTKQGHLKSAEFIDKNGIAHQIDVNNPRTDKYYTTIINDYCAQGNDGFKMLDRPNQIIKKYPFDATECVKNIMKKTTEQIDIKDDGRIKLID